jgi:hypothetical protein
MSSKNLRARKGSLITQKLTDFVAPTQPTGPDRARGRQAPGCVLVRFERRLKPAATDLGLQIKKDKIW